MGRCKLNWVQKTTLGLAISLSLPAAAQTLEQAVAFTLEGNPEIKSAYNEYVSKRYLNDASGGAYRPSIDLDGGIG